MFPIIIIQMSCLIYVRTDISLYLVRLDYTYALLDLIDKQKNVIFLYLFISLILTQYTLYAYYRL